jgi:predicted DNA-binding transcriptional regulator YafY
MPKNKNPHTRLKLIYDFICEGNEPGKKMILKHLQEQGFKVSEKTIVNDLAALKSRDLIYTTGAGRSVEYLPIDKLKTIELEKDILDYDDLFSLEMALISLNQLKFFNLSKDLKNIILKIEKELNKESRTKKEIVTFQNTYLKIDPLIFQTIFEATSHEKAIFLEYKSFKVKTEVTFNFHPFFLKQFNNRWFVIGYREDLQIVDHLGIERIRRVKIVNNLKYNAQHYITPQKYSQHLFGVTKENLKPEKVELLFNAHRAPYFISKPMVEKISTKTEKSGQVKMSFTCIINKEFIAELLSFGSDVIVLSPESLKTRIQDEIKKAARNYKK